MIGSQRKTPKSECILYPEPSTLNPGPCIRIQDPWLEGQGAGNAKKTIFFFTDPQYNRAGCRKKVVGGRVACSWLILYATVC